MWFSYTDEGRIMYMIEHNGTFPPVGYIQPVVNDPS